MIDSMTRVSFAGPTAVSFGEKKKKKRARSGRGETLAEANETPTPRPAPRMIGKVRGRFGPKLPGLSAGTESPVIKLPLFVEGGKGEHHNPTRLLPGESPAVAENVSGSYGPHGRYTLQLLRTSRGHGGESGEVLPHPFVSLTQSPAEAAVFMPLYKDSRGRVRVLTLLEERPSVGRRVLWPPGGSIEANESVSKGAKREALEETRGFKLVSPSIMTTMPFAEAAPYCNMMLYLGMGLVNLSKKPKDRRTDAEVKMLDTTQRAHDPLWATMRDSDKWLRFVHDNQSRLIETDGREGFLVGHPFMFVAALLRDKVDRLIGRYGHRMTRFKG